MKLRTLHFLFLVAVMLRSVCQAQPASESAVAAHHGDIVAAWAREPDTQGDPAYTAYKKGYALILDEKWEEARREFDKVLSRYPRSKYVDDVQYWSAYALMHTNRKMATEAYRRFIRNYPGSSYFDDAVADFARLLADEPAKPALDTLILHLRRQGKPIVIDLQRLEHELQTIRVEPPSTPRPPLRITIMALEESTATMLKRTTEDKKLDQSVRVRIEALRNAGEMLHDRKAFRTLRDVALDQHQPHLLRELAITSLARGDVVDALPVFKEVAQNDAMERNKMLAIQAIGRSKRSKTKALETLIELYNHTPKERIHDQELLLNAIANVNSDGALNFITQNAKTQENDDLRRLAVYHISEMDVDKNKSVEALSGIFRAIPRGKKEELETVMYSVANIGNDQAIDFLASVAGAGDDDNLRGNAIFYLTHIGGEKARAALSKVLERK